MRIVGKWLLADDGVTRPVVEADVRAADGGLEAEIFLIDIGADRTVFSASLLSKLGFPLSRRRPPSALRALAVNRRFWS